MPCDYKEYPDNWHTEIVPAIAARSQNRCEQCGVANHRIIYSYRPTLILWKYAPGYLLIQLANRIQQGQNHFKAMQYLQLSKIVLTTAHLDHDKSNENINLARLAHWCQACHLHHDHSRHNNNARAARYGFTNHPTLF